jgi:uncharacterized protein with HEPN domain
MRDDTERLRDILEAIERLEKYARQGKTGSSGFCVETRSILIVFSAK